MTLLRHARNNDSSPKVDIKILKKLIQRVFLQKLIYNSSEPCKIPKRGIPTPIQYTKEGTSYGDCWIINRGYYTAVRRYEFYLRVMKTEFYGCAQRTSKILF